MVQFLKAFTEKDHWLRLGFFTLMIFSEQWFFNTGGILPCLGIILVSKLAGKTFARLWPTHEKTARLIVGVGWILGGLLPNWPPAVKVAIIVTGILWIFRKPG